MAEDTVGKGSLGSRLAGNAGLTLIYLAIILIGAYFVWLSVRYIGIVWQLGEWQFGRINLYYPALTSMLLALIILIPVALVVWAVIWLMRRKSRESRTLRAFGAAGRLTWFFFAMAAAAGLAAIAALIFAFQLPGGEGPVREVRLGTTGAESPQQGRTTLTGWIDYTRASWITEDLILFKREMYIAPMVAQNSDGTEELRYFVQIPRVGPTARRVPSTATGVLVHRALPREVFQLYRNTRNAVADDHYLLFASAQTARWRPLTIAAEFAVLALVSLAFAWFQRRHRKWLGDEINAGYTEETVSAEPPPAHAG